MGYDQILASNDTAKKDETAMPDAATKRDLGASTAAATSATLPTEAVCGGVAVHQPVAEAGNSTASADTTAAPVTHEAASVLPGAMPIPDNATKELAVPTRGHGGIGDIPKAPEMGADAVAEGFFVAPSSHIEDIAAGRACAADFGEEPAVPSPVHSTSAEKSDAGPFAHGIGNVPVADVLSGVREPAEYVDAEGKDYTLTEEDKAALTPFIGRAPPKAAAEETEPCDDADAEATARPPPPQVLPAAPAAVAGSGGDATSAAPPSHDTTKSSHDLVHQTSSPYESDDAASHKKKKPGFGKRLVRGVKRGVSALAKPFKHKKRHTTHPHDGEAPPPVATVQPDTFRAAAHPPAAPIAERHRHKAAAHDPFTGEKRTAHASG